MRKRHLLVAALVLIASVLCCSAASAQTTAFTYQGKLTDGGTAATGNYDLQFKIFDGSAANANHLPVGSPITITKTGHSVTNGTFIVSLDFGAGVFTGADRFLEIAVRRNSSESFVTLSPRQPISSNPYAIRSANAATADAANSLASACALCVTNAHIQSLDGSKITGSVNFTGLRTETTDFAPNIIEGLNGNSVTAGVSGATIGGGGVLGSLNTVTAHFGTVGGGHGNLAGPLATVGGGQFNTASGQASTVGGGRGNAASGFSSTVPGGQSNMAQGDFSFAAGRNAKSLHQGSFVWGDSTDAEFLSTGNNQFLIRAYGGVGIGTNSPLATLEIQGGADANGDNDPKAIALSYGTGGFRHWIRTRHSAAPGAGAGNAIDFFVNRSAFAETSSRPGIGNVHVMTLDSGRVGVGTTVPLGKLQVVTDPDTNPSTIPGWDRRHFVIGAPDSLGGIGFSYDHTNNVGYISSLSPNVLWRNLILQFGGGNVGIGTNAPSDKLHVSGSVRVDLLGAGGTTSLCQNSAKQISFCSSSIRYKTKITPFGSGLNLINRLSPITFNWKQGGLKDLGLGAEDVEKVEPLLVTYNDQGEVEGVKYDRVAVVLINAVKEQQKQIEEQRNQIASLQTTNTALNSRLRALEKSFRTRNRLSRRHR